MTLKSIVWPENLDKDGDYDEFHDFSSVIMFVNYLKVKAEVETVYIADEKTLDFASDDAIPEASSVEFGLGFWANAQAKAKGKKAIDFVHGGEVRFSIDLSEPDLQESFNKLCENKQTGLSTFVKQCYEAERYEAI